MNVQYFPAGGPAATVTLSLDAPCDLGSTDDCTYPASELVDCNGDCLSDSNGDGICDGANTPPIASDQTVSTSEDTDVSIVLTGADIESTSLTYSIVSGPSNGSLTGTGSTRTYSPNPDFNGVDSFTFVVNDGELNSAEATVSITVDPVNDPPVAFSQEVTTQEDTDVSIALDATDADGDDLDYSVVSGPLNGTLSGTGSTRTYSPNQNYHGSDSFTFVATDGASSSAEVTVTITVEPVNDPPIAIGQAAATSEDTDVSIFLMGSDS